MCLLNTMSIHENDKLIQEVTTCIKLNLTITFLKSVMKKVNKFAIVSMYSVM